MSVGALPASPFRAARHALGALDLPLWPDPELLQEWRRLRADPIFRGGQVPEGLRLPVLLVPGFGASGVVMRPLRDWLDRLGHRPRVASLRWGLDCGERAASALEEQLRRLAREEGQPVLLIAHSRGGQFARVAGLRASDQLAGLVTMGSPFWTGVRALHPAIRVQAGALGVLGSLGVPNLVRLSCVSGRCCTAFRADLRAPWPAGVPFLSLHSRADGAVRWESCLDPGARNLEVGVGHAAMLASRETFRPIAELSGVAANRSWAVKDSNLQP